MKLAVIGDPVAHSKSPQLHTEFLREAGISGSYEALRVPAGRCEEAVERLAAAGYCGLNVTTPLKEEAHAICASLDEVAQRAGAVNTLTLRGGTIRGANTDGIGGLVAIATALGAPVAGKRVLLLGAGPTARAVAWVLQARGARVLVWNRTAQRASRLARAFELTLWEQEMPVDIALSTLPPDADLDDRVHRALRDVPLVIDANYGPRATLAHALGRTVIDGKELLAAQARASFEIWTRAQAARGEGEI